MRIQDVLELLGSYLLDILASYSRSYAKYVTSVKSGTSQGPHIFNSV